MLGDRINDDNDDRTCYGRCCALLSSCFSYIPFLSESKNKYSQSPRLLRPLPLLNSNDDVLGNQFGNLDDPTRPFASSDGIQLHRKIVLLGVRSSGKSSIINVFTNKRFDQEYEPTIEQTFKSTLKFGNSLSFSLEILDTAGLDQYSNISRQGIFGAHGFIFVYSITSRQSFDSVIAIRERLSALIGNQTVPSILVGNKRDLGGSSSSSSTSSGMVSNKPTIIPNSGVTDNGLREVSYDTGKQLAMSWGCPFIECSAMKNDNINLVFETIIKEIEKDSGLISFFPPTSATNQV